MQEETALSILLHFLKAPAIKALIKNTGSAQEALQQTTIPWQQDKLWKKNLELVEKERVSLIGFQSPLYPKALEALADLPLLLYVKGELPKESGVGIVGTRACSLYGKEMAREFARECAAHGKVIVSGLARGIDTAAHEGALETGKTIAIIGSGLGNIYPKENKPLSEEIAKQGAAISEFPMYASPEKHHFPKRNRLISALSDGVLLIEAPLKSGAMITMAMAEKMKKKCFTIPGRLDMSSFQGNHLLIKKGRASLVENGSEMLSVIMGRNVKKESQITLFEMDEEEKRLFSLLPQQEVSLEQLCLVSQLPVAKLSALLMGLVLKQMVQEFPGKLYKKVYQR